MTQNFGVSRWTHYHRLDDISSAYIAIAGGTGLPLAMNDEYQRFISGVVVHAEAHLKASEAGLSVPTTRPTS